MGTPSALKEGSAHDEGLSRGGLALGGRYRGGCRGSPRRWWRWCSTGRRWWWRRRGRARRHAGDHLTVLFGNGGESLTRHPRPGILRNRLPLGRGDSGDRLPEVCRGRTHMGQTHIGASSRMAMNGGRMDGRVNGGRGPQGVGHDGRDCGKCHKNPASKDPGTFGSFSCFHESVLLEVG